MDGASGACSRSPGGTPVRLSGRAALSELDKQKNRRSLIVRELLHPVGGKGFQNT